MFKKTLFALLVVASLLGLGYWYVFTKQSRQSVSNAINAIPTNASIIIESKNMQDVWRKISQTNIIWEEMLITDAVADLNAQLVMVDSVINTQLPLVKLLENHSLFVSAHISGANTFDFLYSYGLPTVRDESVVHNFLYELNQNIAPMVSTYDGVDIKSIKLKNGKDSLSYAFLDGVLMLSKRKSLVENSIRQLKSNSSLLSNPDIQRVVETAGKNVDANVYVNYKNIPEFIKGYLSKKTISDVEALADFASFSGWDVDVKPNAFTFSGFTHHDNLNNTFLSLFNNQKPQEISIAKVLPGNTAHILFWGLSDITGFNRAYKNYLSAFKHSDKFDRQLDEINRKYKVDVERSLLHWMINEIALVKTESYSGTHESEKTFAIFKSSNIETATKSLNELAKAISKVEEEPITSLYYKDYLISQLHLPSVLTTVFGTTFSHVTQNYYCAIEDYIVFSNSTEELSFFIDAYEKNDVLSNNEQYVTFSENIAEEASVFVYSNISRSAKLYKQLLNKKLNGKIDNNMELMSKFNGFAIQFTAGEDLYYSNSYINYNPIKKKENITLWETKLDAPVASKPFLVTNHNTKNKEIFVQDSLNTVYLISNTGKIIWKKQLPEKLASTVYQIDIYRNNKLQLLFNTKSKIYLLDRNGKHVDGYPVVLKSPATNGLAVFDYDRNRKYRVFVATEDNEILCYNARGIKVKGFKAQKTSAPVKNPIKYMRVGNKDLICAIDDEGEIYLLNRKGEKRVKLKQRLNHVQDYYVSVGKNYARTYLIGMDSLGNVNRVSLSDNIEKIKFQHFDTTPMFSYVDLNQDKVKDYVFVSNQIVRAYKQNKRLLSEYNAKMDLSYPAAFYKFRNGKVVLGVVGKKQNKLHLLNKQGDPFKGFPVSGNTQFSIGDINNDGRLNIVTGSVGGRIYLYQMDFD